MRSQRKLLTVSNRNFKGLRHHGDKELLGTAKHRHSCMTQDSCTKVWTFTRQHHTTGEPLRKGERGLEWREWTLKKEIMWNSCTTERVKQDVSHQHSSLCLSLLPAKHTATGRGPRLTPATTYLCPPVTGVYSTARSRTAPARAG